MRKILFTIPASLLVLAGTLSAASLCTPSSAVLTVAGGNYIDGLLYPGTTSGGTAITCGSVTFSNFQVYDAAPSTSTGAPFVLLSGSYDMGTTTLNFNPNLNNASVLQDIHLFFNVSSTTPITSIGLQNGGSLNSGINERACGGSINSGSGICATGVTTLATLTAFGGGSSTSLLTMPSTSLNIYKDIGHPAGGELTGFTQTFTATGVPEPATFALFGGGLLLFALARRKKSV